MSLTIIGVKIDDFADNHVTLILSGALTNDFPTIFLPGDEVTFSQYAVKRIHRHGIKLMPFETPSRVHLALFHAWVMEWNRIRGDDWLERFGHNFLHDKSTRRS